MSILGVSSVLADVYQYTDKIRKASAGGTSFLEKLQNTGEKEEKKGVEAYQEYLKQNYGNVLIQDVGKDQKSMDRLGAGTSGTGNVVIAPNILEQMANDPEKA